jgi:hypothetical protein
VLSPVAVSVGVVGTPAGVVAGVVVAGVVAG